MMVCNFDLSTWKAETDLCEFKAILVYIVTLYLNKNLFFSF